MSASSERPEIRSEKGSAVHKGSDLPSISINQADLVSLSIPMNSKQLTETSASSDINASSSSEMLYRSQSQSSGKPREDKKQNLKRKQSMVSTATTLIDYEQMSSLHQEFLDRWNGQDLGLNKDEFQAAVSKSFNVKLTTEEVDRLFKQMDTRNSGLMRWSDYIASISRTAQLRSYMADREIKPLLQDKMTFIKTKHRDEIVTIRFMPRLSLQSTKINYSSGRYLMLGRQGHLSIWSLNLQIISTHYIGATEGLNPLFFVDMVVLYPSTLIAVTSTDRKIILYELGSRGIQEKYSIVTLGNCITCLDFWSDLCSRTTSLLVWGDTAGDIHALELNVNRLGGIFEKDQNQEVISRVVYADLVKNKFPAVHLYRVAGVHDDWVTSVKYIPENKAFLSSSRSSNRQSMLYTDWNGKVESRYFLTNKAVLCFDYNHIINVLVTGSLDCRVRVWNFFMGQRPVSTLTAHTSPITQISLNPSTQHVISVDKSRAVKIFDYLEGTVIQSFSGPSLGPMGKRTEITGFFFNQIRCQLILATTVLGTANKRTNPSYMAEISAHDFPISAVCYSSAFGEILTACCNAQISVWDVHTGKHLLQFSHFSSRSQFQDLPWAKDNVRLEVTAMALDSTERCLLTGSNDGTVNLWNFSTGVMLTHYTLPDNSLVTGLCMDRNYVYATGWFKHVYLLDLAAKSLNARRKCFARYHEDEINCMTLVKGGLLATGSYDGDVVIVSRDTGHPLCVLNAGVSEFPRAMRGKKDENDSTEQQNIPSEDKESTASSFSGWSEDELIATEDHSILRCIRISKDLVMVSNAITGDAVRILHKPKEPKVSSADLAFPVYDALKGCYVSHDESAANFKAYESSVEAMLFLHTRKHLDANTATLLTAGAEGWIRAWSLSPTGGLKGQFLATEFLGEAVKAFATDVRNEYLITGDTMGYVKVWDIWPYCNAAAKRLSPEERQARRDKFIGMFIFLRSPFLRDRASEGFKQCQNFHKRRPPEVSNPSVTLKTPCILNVFRAHLQAITCIQYVNDHSLIITGGKDCSVRIWSLRGSFVGQCGAPWVKLPDPYVVKIPLRVLPSDLRRNGSARTLRIIKAGCVPLWDYAMQCVKSYLEEQRKEQHKKAELEAKKVQAIEGGEAVVPQEQEAESIITQPVPLGPEEHDLPEDMRLANVVNFNWQDPKKSRILGKSFKPNLHHRPVNPVTIEDEFGMYPAYRKIKVIDITHITRIPTPQLVNDMEIRRREEEEEAQRARQLYLRKKSKVVRGHTKAVPIPSWMRGKDRKSSNFSAQEVLTNPSISHTESSVACSQIINLSVINTNTNRNTDETLDNTATSTHGDTDITVHATGKCLTHEPRELQLVPKKKQSFFLTQSSVESVTKGPTTSPAKKVSRLKLCRPIRSSSSRNNNGCEQTHGIVKLKRNEDVTEETDRSYMASRKRAYDCSKEEEDHGDSYKKEENRCSKDVECMFPPISVAPKQLTGSNKPGASVGSNNLGSRRGPQSKASTKLPVLEEKKKLTLDMTKATRFSR